jgi:TatD DNase family protein
VIIDTHVHLLDSKFDIDREDVLERAFGVGVKKIIEVSCEVDCWNKALSFSNRKDIFISLGIHPNSVFKAKSEDYKKLKMLIQNKKCVAVGEIGLDYHYDSSPQNISIQKNSLAKQLDIAIEFRKPVILHCRDAYDDLINFFQNYNKPIPKGVVHCFSGTLIQSKIFVKLGFLLGIDGPLTYKKSNSLRQIVFETDLDNLLVETDCPYLSPQKYRGLRNEPSYIIELFKKIKEIKDISFDKVVQMTTQNAFKLFKEIV